MPAFLKKLFPPAGQRQPAENKKFEDKQRQEDAFDKEDIGLQPVALNRIVGSVGRYQDFDHRFHPKSKHPSPRLEKIKAAMAAGKTFPAIDLYRIKDEFYVLDGNHRVSAAMALGHEFIDAHIIEFLPSKNTLENVIYRERSAFLKKTGLPDTIQVTEVGQFDYLLKQIEEHRQFLQSDTAAKPASLEHAAHDWYQTIYRPLSRIIKNSRLPKSLPNRTVADLFAYITFHQWERGRRRAYGIGIDQLIPKDMERFRSKMVSMNTSELPEMTHWVTAFILISVKAGQEYVIMKKLFEMAEIKEVHFVYGEFDLLAKMALKRDLLASDAEIIGRAVHENVRRIADVIKTQTLVPISSMRKPSEA